MRKKLVTLLLATSLAVGCLAGCGNDAKEKESSEKSSEKSEVQKEETDEAEEGDGIKRDENGNIAMDAFAGTEITIAILKNAADPGDGSHYGEKTIVKMAEEATGIKVNFVPIDASVRSEKGTIMLADPNNMPDACIAVYTEGEVSKNMELFADVSELMKTFAPDVYEDYVAADILDDLTWSDGSIRGFATGTAGGDQSCVKDVMWINQAWLDQLGMDMPTTTEEFYEVLCAFRDNDMNGNGDTTDEIPFCFANKNWVGRIWCLAGWWGCLREVPWVQETLFVVEDGQPVPTFDTDAFRSYLEYCHKCFEEGLFDKEGFSMDASQYTAKLNEGRVGVYMTWSPIYDFTDPELGSQYVLLKPLQALEGVKPIQPGYGLNTQIGNKVGFTVSENSENKEAVLWWYNYCMGSSVNKWIGNEAEQGIGWDIDENGNFYYITDIVVPEEAAAQGMDATGYLYYYGLFKGGIGGVMLSDEVAQLDRNDPDPRNAAVLDLLEYTPEEYVPMKTVDEEFMNERNMIQSDLLSYAENFMATAMLEGLTDQAWQEHLDTLESVGYYDWIEWWKEYFNS